MFARPSISLPAMLSLPPDASMFAIGCIPKTDQHEDQDQDKKLADTDQDKGKIPAMASWLQYATCRRFQNISKDENGSYADVSDSSSVGFSQEREAIAKKRQAGDPMKGTINIDLDEYLPSISAPSP